jgi:hypothetical protein
MTWRRGFWRLWLVASVLWAAGLTIYAIFVMWDYARAVRAAGADPGPMLYDIAALLIAVLIPPALVLAMGLVIGWIISGFGSPDSAAGKDAPRQGE